MPPLTRRQLVQGAAASTLAAPLTSARTVLRTRPGSPNDELRVACVGVRSRGRSHIHGLHRLEGVRVVALVDADARELRRARTDLEERYPEDSFELEADVRTVLERDDIDAVSLATPNHLHALHAIWACQAGKHVYVEKPVSHNVFEGRQLVRAARKYGVVVQAGTQSRSSHAIRDGIAWVRAGNLGAIQIARGTCFKPRNSIGRVEGPQEVPEEVDWDLYCGPAPLAPLMRRNLHYDWHWQFATGNGDLGNQGVHQVDLCRWAIGADAVPPGVLALGGRFGYEDDGDTPNTMAALFDYGPAPILFEVRGLPRDRAAREENWGAGMDRYLGAAIGVTVHCEGGTLSMPNYSTAVARDREGKEVWRWEGAEDHFANFVAAVRAGDPGAVSAPIEDGHVSSALCHLANVSYLRGETAAVERAREELAQHAPAREGLERLAAHLGANEVDLERTPLALGPYLTLDPATEEVTNDDGANPLLTRDYRAGFVVPDEV